MKGLFFWARKRVGFSADLNSPYDRQNSSAGHCGDDFFLCGRTVGIEQRARSHASLCDLKRFGVTVVPGLYLMKW